MRTHRYNILVAFRRKSLFAILLLLFAFNAQAEWRIDLSRRQNAMKDLQGPNKQEVDPENSPKGVFDQVLESGDPVQEIALLLTEKGFVPGTLRLRNGVKYLIHVVNVNEKEKNVSFILDAFSEHHDIYFGKMKSFRIEPKKDGIFSFMSPEVSQDGRVVVFSPGQTIRVPASEGSR